MDRQPSGSAGRVTQLLAIALLAAAPFATGVAIAEADEVGIPQLDTALFRVPKAGACKPEGGLRGWPLGVDAPPLPFAPGDNFAIDQLPLLEAYFPPQLWRERERFFYAGMRLEIGPCFADYAPPGFFADAIVNSLAQLAGVRRVVHSFGFFSQQDTHDGSGHLA